MDEPLPVLTARADVELVAVWLDAGLHMLCEKPMTLLPADAWDTSWSGRPPCRPRS